MRTLAIGTTGIVATQLVGTLPIDVGSASGIVKVIIDLVIGFITIRGLLQRRKQKKEDNNPLKTK